MDEAQAVTQELARIWCSVLGHDEIHADDNFFELGGTSMSAVTMVARVEAELGYAMPLSFLLEGGTFDALVRSILALASTSAASSQG